MPLWEIIILSVIYGWVGGWLGCKFVNFLKYKMLLINMHKREEEFVRSFVKKGIINPGESVTIITTLSHGDESKSNPS